MPTFKNKMAALIVPWNGWKNTSANLHFLLTVLVASSLLLNIQLCSLATVLLFVNWIAGQGYKQLGATIWREKQGYLLPAFFILHVIGLLYSSNLKYGVSDLERKLSLLVLPLVLLSRPLSSLQRDFVLFFFTVFALFLSSIGLIRGVQHYDMIVSTRGPEHLITHFADMHRVYFSIYLFFCYLCLFYFYNKYKSHLPRIWEWVTLGCGLLIITFIFIMASRMVLILLILSSVFIVFYFTVIKQKQYLKAFLLSLFVFLLVGIVYTQVDHVHRFMAELTEKLDAGQTQDVNSVNIRVVKYKCAVQGIEANWLLGVGTGDIQDTLNHLYRVNGFHKGYEVNMDAHNQYLQTWLGQGIPGLLLLLAFLYLNLKKGIREHNFPLTFLLCIFAVCSLSESLLTTQKGIVFIALFFPLTYYSDNILQRIGQRN